VGAGRARWNASDPTFGSRFECKYLIDPCIVASIREFLGPFTRPDQFAANRPNLQYPVSSLYLDSDSLGLYQQTAAGEKDRFKLRVRTYSDEPTSRAFFEVKQKIDRIVHKRRAGLTRAQAASVLERGTLVAEDGLSTGVRDDLNFFLHYVHLIGARPIVRVKYQREAYEALGNEPVRVTLDSDLSHAITLNSNLSHQTGRWSATPLNGVILEIKFTERFPWWVQELVHQFGLNQRAVPKYLLSIDHMLHAGRESALSIAGITLPPQGV
jgi:hypothetical protein